MAVEVDQRELPSRVSNLKSGCASHGDSDLSGGVSCLPPTKLEAGRILPPILTIFLGSFEGISSVFCSTEGYGTTRARDPINF